MILAANITIACCRNLVFKNGNIQGLGHAPRRMPKLATIAIVAWIITMIIHILNHWIRISCVHLLSLFSSGSTLQITQTWSRLVKVGVYTIMNLSSVCCVTNTYIIWLMNQPEILFAHNLSLLPMKVAMVFLPTFNFC